MNPQKPVPRPEEMVRQKKLSLPSMKEEKGHDVFGFLRFGEMFSNLRGKIFSENKNK